MPECKKVIGFLLFTTLILVKVSAFHVYVHHDSETDEIENCTVCDLVMENQGSELQFSTPVVEMDTPEVIQVIKEIVSGQQLKTIRFNFSLFSRPPPHIA
ncbi:hypothetical protein [Flagellimonas onchidii]|uniref:hypothetical protein n=1 Tax=Flagellimonas onchidii TaxID=2562684 RepID=UPI0010A61719|nr:hypothetical protein [Allomuricauda onchidii]